MIFIEVMKERFGEFEGETVWKWTMVNDHGMRMSVLNYGAIVTSLKQKINLVILRILVLVLQI